MTELDATASRFWIDLGAQHEHTLEGDGRDRFKRTVALRHFNWRWHWRALPRSEQARFLLAHNSPTAFARAVREPMVLDDDAWTGVDWSRADRRLYTAAVRLLWQYATKHGDPQVLALDEPTLGAPLPVHRHGRLISQDLANSSLEVAAIVRALGGRVPERIAEIGAGYGRTAYALLHRFPSATYTIIDIEPTRTLSRWYLTHLFPAERIELVDPSDVTGLATAGFDLTLSISSLQEMTTRQTAGYLALIDRVGEGGDVYLKQWRKRFNDADGYEFRFEQLPIANRWKQTFFQRCPVQTRFVEGAWHVDSASR